MGKVRLVMLCRGSAKEGLGHLYRTKGFALAALAAGHDVTVLALSTPDLAAIFQGVACRVSILAQDTDLPACIAAEQPDVLIFDLVHLPHDIFTACRPQARLTASISPIFNNMSCVDLLFTRARTPVVSSGPQVFSGLDYALFNPHCRRISTAQYENSLRADMFPIAICIGGGDIDNLTKQALRAVMETEVPCCIWTLLGDAYPHSYDDLVSDLRGWTRHEIILARTNRSMWNILGNCALGILSSGLATLEAIYAGLPTIMVRRQHDRANELSLDYKDRLLDGGAFEDGSYRRLPRLIEDLSRDHGQLRSLRRQQMDMVDDGAASRILDIITLRLAGGMRG